MNHTRMPILWCSLQALILNPDTNNVGVDNQASGLPKSVSLDDAQASGCSCNKAFIGMAKLDWILLG